MKNLLLILNGITFILFNTSCSTSTKTANAVDYTAAAIATGGVLVTGDATYLAGIPLSSRVKHQIQIKGVIICEAKPLQNFSSLQIELKESNKGVFQIPANSNGEYNSTIKSFEGKHTLVLLQKRTNKILDQVEFISTNETDRFEINLNSCKE